MNTLFLATVLGWYMVIFGLLVLIRHEFVKAAMTDILESRGLYFMVAIMTLLLGLLIVSSHNIWMMGWPVIITVFGWLVVVGGVSRLFFSEAVHHMAHEFLKAPMKMKVMGAILVVVGGYLLLHVHHFHFLTHG